MTTLAYKDGVLAADQMISDGLRFAGTVTKIAQSPTGELGGFTGDASVGREFLTWVKEGAIPQFVPRWDADEGEGLVFRLDGSAETYDEKGRWHLITAPFHSKGSGCDFAIGAMAAGASAAEAVAIAMRFDVKSGGEVECLFLGSKVGDASDLPGKAVLARLLNGEIIHKSTTDYGAPFWWLDKPYAFITDSIISEIRATYKLEELGDSLFGDTGQSQSWKLSDEHLNQVSNQPPTVHI